MDSLTDPQTPIATDGALAAPFISMSADEAADLAHRHFGLVGALTRFATEKDDTFRIEADDGRRYIMKLANPVEDAGEIAFQTDLLQHIACTDPSLPVPRVLRAKADGATAVWITDRAQQRRLLRLLSYLDGTPLDSTHSSADQRACVGRVLGRLRHAMAGFSHPGEARVLAWDVQHLLTLEHLLDHVPDAQHKRMLADGLARYRSLMPRILALRSQVLHNDFSQSNIVVDHAHDTFVTGIIDFGDAVRTAIAIDVSTAVLNQLPRDLAQHPRADIFGAGRDLVRGYLDVADLDAQELDLIPHLVMGRVVGRALITVWRSGLLPENAPYILRNTEQGWAQLEWFLGHDIDEVSAIFRGDAF